MDVTFLFRKNLSCSSEKKTVDFLFSALTSFTCIVVHLKQNKPIRMVRIMLGVYETGIKSKRVGSPNNMSNVSNIGAYEL